MSKLNDKMLLALANKVAKNQGKNVIPSITNTGGVKISAEVGELPTPIANEFYTELFNLIRSQIYHDGVDVSAYADKLSPFADSKQWINGRIQLVGKDLKVPDDGYQKDLAFDKIFNPVDRTIISTFGNDSYKKSVREKLDRTIVNRSINDGDAIAFVNNIQKKQNDDLATQLFNDFIDFYKLAIGTFATIEVDTTEGTEIDPLIRKQQQIVKAEKDAIEYLKLPQTSWNETGFVYARPAEKILIVRDPFVNNEIEVYLSANSFQLKYIEPNLQFIKIPFYSEDTKIYSVVHDRDKVKYRITIDETATQILDGFQIAFSSRMFYGMYNVPWLGGIVIIEAGTVPAPTATITSIQGTDPTTIDGTDGSISFDATIANFVGAPTAVLNPASGTSPLTLTDGANPGLIFEDLEAGDYTVQVLDGSDVIQESNTITLTDPEEA